MEASAINANVRFENYHAYNNNNNNNSSKMSGFTTEQSQYEKPTMIHGKKFNNSCNDIEFMADDLNDELQDIEIIAIDPNSFYTTSDEDEDEDEDDEGEEDSDEHDGMSAMAGVNMNKQNGNIHVEVHSAATNPPTYHSMAYDVQPTSSDDFDIITLNIDDDFPIDAHDDDILFRNQFDLANYIGGGSASSEFSSLLLTPVKDATANAIAATATASPLNIRQQVPQFLLPNRMNAEPIEMSTINTNINSTAAAYAKVAKTPASNRRKRKNLSREFILESDDSSDTDSNNKFNSVINNKINQMVGDRKANGKRKSIKEDDPLWNPMSLKRNTMATKLSNEHKEHKTISKTEHKNMHTKIPAKQICGKGKGLRNLLKQQLLSDRPINKSNLLKTKSSPLLSTTITQNVTKVAQAPVHRIGVGRGKDIAITAKYYNRTESSDDDSNIEHGQKSNKTYRYDQIYTDSEDSDMEIDVSTVPASVPELKSKMQTCSQEMEKEMTIANKTDKFPEDKGYKKKETLNGKSIESNREKPREEKTNHVRNGSVDRKTNVMMVETPSKPTDSNKTKLNLNSSKPILTSQSLDSTEFAKALVVNAKAKTISKCKSSASVTSSSSLSIAAAAAKKKNLEQQKRLIKSNILLQNPAKFKLLALEKTASAITTIKPIVQTATVATSSVGIETISNDIATNGVVNEKLQTEAKPITANPIKIETENTVKDENQNADEAKNVKCADESNEDIKPDISTQADAIVDDLKNEANAKRKLNIQEYLQRKSLKTADQNGIKGNQFVNSIKKERTDAMSNSNNTKDKSNNAEEEEGDEESNTGCLAGNSMYEEIIIVSIGCNTDISIPKTPLLSNIQTSVVEANSKISCSSLISSIQDVLLKKTQCNEQTTATAKKVQKSSDPRKNKQSNSKGEENDNGDGSEEMEEEHGENKVIMHLRKDRVRPMRHTISIQTDPYFQFPPLRKLVPASRKQSTLGEKTIKRMNSFPRGASENRLTHDNHYLSNGKNRAHSNSVGRSRLSESNSYSGDDEYQTQRPSRHSQFMEQHKLRQQQQQQRQKRNYRNSHGRDSSRYSISKYERYSSRNRTISRSLSSSSDSSVSSSTSSSASSSTSRSSSSSCSSAYISNASPRSLNSYGGSSSKSYYVCEDDHQYYRKRTTSGSNSRRNNTHRRRHANATKHRSNSPEERRIVYVGRLEDQITKDELRHKFSVYGQVKHVSIHQKETKMKYGFVTYARPCNAYTAIDDSSKNAAISHYDISFGGRRTFCREQYFDLDNTIHATYGEESASTPHDNDVDDEYAELLRKVKEKLQKNKK